MITVTKQENGVLFTFQDSDKYLYGSGTIEVPFNSLSIIQDESDNITLRKSASNDIFLSARFDSDFGYASKEEAVNALKEILYDEAGISEEEVQQMIDAATSGIPSSQVVEQLRTDVNTLSGTVDTHTAEIAGLWYTIDEKEEVIASALTQLNQDVADIDAKEEVIASALTEVNLTLDNKLDASAITSIESAVTNVQSAVTAVSNDLNTLSGAVIDNEYTVSQAINSLNTRVTAVESGGSAITTAITSGSTDSEIPTAKATYDAIQAGGGGGANVVQTTGTSTTDVMSQDAVTDAFNTYTAKRDNDEGIVRYWNWKTPNHPYGDNVLYNFSINGKLPLSKQTKATDYRNIFNFHLVETSAITTSMTSSSTDAQVPSAKAVYDQLGGLKLVKLTQAEYDALATKDVQTLYIVVD